MAHRLIGNSRDGPSAFVKQRTTGLLFPVRFDVMFGRLLGVLGGLNRVSMGDVGVVGGCFMVAFGVVLGGFAVVARSVLVMFRCLGMMLSCFLRHNESFHGRDFRLWEALWIIVGQSRCWG